MPRFSYYLILNVSLLPALNRPPRRGFVITTEAVVDSQIVVVVAAEQVNDAQMSLPALIAIQQRPASTCAGDYIAGYAALVGAVGVLLLLRRQSESALTNPNRL